MLIVRRLTHVIALVLTLAVGAASAAMIVSQTSWFKNWLRGYIVREAHQYLNGTVSIERLGGNLFFGVEMENIGLSLDGSQVVAVKDLGIDYSVFELLTSGSIRSIRIDKPIIYLRRDGDAWSLSRLVKKQETEADRRGPTKPIGIDSIGISGGSVIFQSPAGVPGVDVPKRFEHLDAKLSFMYEPVRYSIQIAHVSFRASEPQLELNSLSGGVAVKDDTVFLDKVAVRTAETSLSIAGAVQHYLTTPTFNLQIGSDKTSVAELARLVPALDGIRLQPSFNVKAEGPLDRLSAELNVQSSAGTVSAKVVADLLTPGQSIAGDLAVQHLELSSILNDPALKSDITGTARMDLHGEALAHISALRGTLSIDAPRVVAAGYVVERVHANARVNGREVGLDGHAVAYGAQATFAGRVTLPDLDRTQRAVAYDLHGQAGHVDLRKLPRGLNVPPAATDINAEYHVVSPAAPTAGSANARLKPRATSLTADLRFQPSTIAGAGIAGGSTAGVTVAGGDISYRADATVAHLNLQRVGEQFGVPALTTARYSSSINGHIVASGRGTTAADLDVTANGTLTDSSILDGAIPQLTFDAALADDTAHVKASGRFRGFDPAVATGKGELQGAIGGALDVDATLAHVSGGVTPESVQVDGTLTLTPSTIGGLVIARASVDGTYRNSTGEIRALDIVGRDVNAHASGTLALNDTGQSNLKIHADSESLQAIGQLVDLPIAGIGAVDATVTGNARELKATGDVTGAGVTYGDNGALTVSSHVTAAVPDLTFADANVAADTHATFVTVAGQNINELDATTTYRQKLVTFDATAKQPRRSLGATGSLVIHPDHQEVHLQRLGLQTLGQTWQLAEGSQATINYAHDALEMKGVAFVSGAQHVAADGTFGRPGSALRVTLTNVDLSSVDALLLRPPQLTGRLNASGTIAGSAEAPDVQGDFRVDAGGFQQYRYDTFGGTARYTGHGVTLDARLQQNPTTFVTAKGHVPIGVGEAYALHIESTPIDLGLVQGVTTQLSTITGTVQATVDVSGSAADPRPTGVITLDNAGFTVEATGVSYTNLRGRIDLQPEKVHIDHISVLDNHQSSLSITGDLAIHELEVGNVELYITANDFKVIDNPLGNVRMNSAIEVAGELRSPRITGDLGVSTGQVDLDRILSLMDDSAYATKAVEYLPNADADTPPVPPSPFDALTLDLRMTVPDDLVVKASDLRAPGAPIGLGTMNVTLGGDLRATKAKGEPIVLVGAVNTVRGTYDFQGRRFDILRDGTIRFAGEPLNDLDPILDIRTRRMIQGVEARVNVTGTLKTPEIMLASTPPLEQADILSLIVFNQSLNTLGEGQQISLGQRAGQLAAGALAGELSKSIGNVLGLDTFEINTAPVGGGAASLTIGQQLGRNLYVKVEQAIGGQSETNFILEYELTRWLRLQTNVLQGSSTQQLFQRMQGSGIDLLFFFSY